MLTLPEVRALLEDRNLKEVSRRSGVPYMSLYYFMKGRNSPKYDTIKTLVDYLRSQGVQA